MKRLIALTLSLLLALTLCACGQSSDSDAKTDDSDAKAEDSAQTVEITKETAAGEYAAFAYKIEGYESYLMSAELLFDGTLTLEESGQGEIMLNDETQDITEWSLDGMKLSIDCDGTTFEGDFQDDGVAIVNVNGVSAYFAKEGTDTSAYELAGKGVYMMFAFEDDFYPYAIQKGDYLVENPSYGTTDEGVISLVADGTGTMNIGDGETVDLLWNIDDDGNMTFMEADGSGSEKFDVEFVELGILHLVLTQDGEVLDTYYVGSDADTSGLETVTMDEYLANAG